MCDFEDDTCDWVQDTEDEMEFTRMSGPSEPGFRSGPSRDHTTQYLGNDNNYNILFLYSAYITL